MTGEDLGFKPSNAEQTKFEYSPLGMSLSKTFKKNGVKSVAKSLSDFTDFTKGMIIWRDINRIWVQ